MIVVLFPESFLLLPPRGHRSCLFPGPCFLFPATAFLQTPGVPACQVCSLGFRGEGAVTGQWGHLCPCSPAGPCLTGGAVCRSSGDSGVWDRWDSLEAVAPWAGELACQHVTREGPVSGSQAFLAAHGQRSQRDRAVSGPRRPPRGAPSLFCAAVPGEAFPGRQQMCDYRENPLPGKAGWANAEKSVLIKQYVCFLIETLRQTSRGGTVVIEVRGTRVTSEILREL